MMLKKPEYWKLRKRLPDRRRWRTGFTRRYRPVIRETTVRLSDTNTEPLQLLIIFQLIFT